MGALSQERTSRNFGGSFQLEIFAPEGKLVADEVVAVLQKLPTGTHFVSVLLFCSVGEPQEQNVYD
ncbi:UNVERIFIED_CONTAM: hypothetical protein Slati_1704500 [Sesamum latifolium]|uniref:Uncharacterized protein n=1 Tax=Sesamum latifolium TaxID=2727402 RepID=A0AAW2X0W4_9LAMI